MSDRLTDIDTEIARLQAERLRAVALAEATAARAGLDEVLARAEAAVTRAREPVDLERSALATIENRIKEVQVLQASAAAALANADEDNELGLIQLMAMEVAYPRRIAQHTERLRVQADAVAAAEIPLREAITERDAVAGRIRELDAVLADPDGPEARATGAWKATMLYSGAWVRDLMRTAHLPVPEPGAVAEWAVGRSMLEFLATYALAGTPRADDPGHRHTLARKFQLQGAAEVKGRPADLRDGQGRPLADFGAMVQARINPMANAGPQNAGSPLVAFDPATRRTTGMPTDARVPEFPNQLPGVNAAMPGGTIAPPGESPGHGHGSD